MSRFRWLTGRKGVRNSASAPELAPMPDVVRHSDDADVVARELLAIMQEQGKDKPAGTELSYEIPEDKRVVSPMTLTLSLMTLADEYGLRFTSLALGVVTAPRCSPPEYGRASLPLRAGSTFNTPQHLHYHYD